VSPNPSLRRVSYDNPSPVRVRAANGGRNSLELVLRRYDVGVAPLGPEKNKHLLTKSELALLSYGTLSPNWIVGVTDGPEGKRWKLAAQ